ncbi:flippase [Candidatus Peregrinibacteria bacterium]|nr:flippase [Candidatus Peregrinibacteria bacterium]
MSLARKILSNTAWQILGKVVTAILGIISIKFITNYLSRSAYGEYTTIYDYTALFTIIADFGLFTIAVREMAHHNTKENVEKIVGNVLSIRTALAVISLSVGVIAAALIPAYRGSHIPYGVFIVSFATIIALVASTMSSVLQFHLRMHWASISLSIGKFVTVAYIVAVIFFFFPKNPEAGFPHLLFAWIIGSLVTILITYGASSRLVPIKYKFDFLFWREVLLKALPYGIALVLGTIYFRMGTIALSLFKLKEQTGLYGVPLRFLEILQIIPHYFMNSVLPILTISLKENHGRAVNVVRYSINALAMMAFPILIGGYLLAWPITAAVSSPDFLTHRAMDGGIVWGSDLALKILLVAMTFTYLHVVLSYTLVAMGRQVELLWINAIVVVINVTLNFILAPQFGFVGAAISAVTAEVVMFIGLFLRVRKRISAVWDLKFLAKTAFSSAAMGVVLFFAADPLVKLWYSQSLVVLIPLGGLVFAGAMFLTRAISKDMLLLLKKTDQNAELSHI